MCKLCEEHHGEHDEKWYLNFENYLFDKLFPSTEEQEQRKKTMLNTFVNFESLVCGEDYARNPDFLRKRHTSNWGMQVVTGEEALQILELAEEAMKREDSIVVVGHCPCMLSFRGVRDYRCIGFGMPVTMAMEAGYAKLPKEGLTEFGGAEWRELRVQLRKGAKVPLKIEEAKQLLPEWEKRGLYHAVGARGTFPLIDSICHCERPYCMLWRNRDIYGVNEAILKGHYVARIDQEQCTSCGACQQRCQFGAIYSSADITNVDPTRCFGCGLCRVGCKHEAIKMIPRQSVPAARELW